MQKERVAIVTGGTRGMGQAISLELARRGAVVFAVYRSDEGTASQTRALLQEINPRCDVVLADVSDEHAVKALVRDIGEETGRIDILVNNAGIFGFSFLEEMTSEYLDQVYSCNFKSQVFMLQAVVPYMKKNHFGRIINASSISGRFADVGLVAYAASKAGVNMLTAIGSAELAPYGITVNAYAPGMVHTDMTDEMIQERGGDILKNISLHRFGTVEDVSSLVAFLASDEAGYITGEIIGLDGGMFKVQNAERAHDYTAERG